MRRNKWELWMPTFVCHIVVLLGTLFLCMGAGTAQGQVSTFKQMSKQSSTNDGPVEIKADVLEYNKTSGWATGRGNVWVRRGSEELWADYARVNANTGEAHAYGNVRLKRPQGDWRGEKLDYNFKDRTVSAGDFSGDAAPFRYKAKSGERVPNSTEYICRDVFVTTCSNDLDSAHWHMTAREMSVVPTNSLSSSRSVIYIGSVPIFYLPYWYRNLNENFGFRFYPGYSSRMGGFLLTSYRYPLGGDLKGKTHLDYRSRRGVAIGQDIEWKDPELAYSGEIETYYLRDSHPLDDNDKATDGIDEQRYRVKLKNMSFFTSHDYVFLQANYLSDTDIVEDFFEDEYRESSQPDNHAVYTHRGENYTVNLQVRGRINDFYDSVNRIPELGIEFFRQPVFGSPIYYDGQSSASYLEKTWSSMRSNVTDYSAFRFDTHHMLYYPDKYFGFLVVVPRAGYRGTYYDQTKMTVTNTVAGTTNSVVTDETGPATFRSMMELGCESSFRAFRSFDCMGTRMRHVVEPYVNYTYIPEPNVLPGELWQFDWLDSLSADNSLRAGIRNKIQTRDEATNVCDRFFLDVSTRFLMAPEPEQDAMQDVSWKMEIIPSEYFRIDYEGIYDPNESLVKEMNARLRMTQPEAWTMSWEYRFKNEKSRRILGDWTAYLVGNWDLNVYGRYEAEDSRFEEHGGYIQKNFDCMSWRLGYSMLPGYKKSDGTMQEDEWRTVLMIWLTAFPDMRLSAKHIQ